MKPGEWCGIGLFGTALAMDAALISRGHETISTCVRVNKVEKAIAIYLVLHFAMRLKVDPLALAGAAFTNYLAARQAVEAATG